MLAHPPQTSAHQLSFQSIDSFSSPSKRRRLSPPSSHLLSDDINNLPSFLYHATSSTTNSPVVVNTSDIPIENIGLYMPNSAGYSSSQNGSHTYAHDNLSTWAAGGGNIGNGTGIMTGNVRHISGHQRHPSTSSVGSAASVASSPYQAPQVSRGMRGSGQISGKQSSITQGNQRQQSFSRSHLPTPQQTPTRHSFPSPHPISYSQQSQDIESTAQANLLMSAALLKQQQSDDDSNQMAHHIRNGLPAPAGITDRQQNTPQFVHSDSMSAALMPKFSRTVTDAYQDNLYFAQPASSTQQAPNTTYLMPSNTMVNDRLLEAQMARSQSSGSNHSQPMSPFRAYAQVDDQQYQVSPHASVEPKTISPKEALLDYNPSNDYPLFPQSNTVMTNAYASATPNGGQDVYNNSSELNYTNSSWNTNMQAFTTAPMQAMTSFATPALPTPTIGNMTGYGSSNMPQPSRIRQRTTEHTPEFTPAQLTRMESSASEAPQSSQASSAQVVVSPKPESAADSGTYSCTYHGCVQRFTTPQKLQKHKRDSHRSSTNVTPGVGSGMTTAQLMERNSQTGPHVCGRTNPTTGKPCDAVFSRPYDLTRHEDTIHNIRKQKVRCAICTEEKTFSRSDALTRHMRVVHPEVDFPGKHRKRGSRDEA